MIKRIIKVAHVRSINLKKKLANSYRISKLFRRSPALFVNKLGQLTVAIKFQNSRSEVSSALPCIAGEKKSVPYPNACFSCEAKFLMATKKYWQPLCRGSRNVNNHDVNRGIFSRTNLFCGNRGFLGGEMQRK